MNEDKRRYYQVSKAGSLKNLKMLESPVPTPPVGSVLVTVRSIGLNYADIFAITGLYSATPSGAFIPGLEFCGVVAKSASPLFLEGQRVIGVTRFGGYDSHIIADPDYLTLLPEGWTFQEGAAFPVQTLTAYYALKTLGDIQPGMTVLIHSAAGGVGLQANRIAKKYSAFTIGVVGTAGKMKILKDEGYDRAIVRNSDFATDLREALAGRELNLVLEATGGKYFRYSYDALAPMGRIIAYGSAQFTPASDRPNYLALAFRYFFRPRVDPLSMIKANKSLMAFNLIWLYERKRLMKDLLSEIGKLDLPPPLVGHEFSFDKMTEALQLFKGGTTVGKVVINVNGE
jgi:NADPH:quinone reductase-like Zn-dependent oxidoreductase